MYVCMYVCTVRRCVGCYIYGCVGRVKLSISNVYICYSMFMYAYDTVCVTYVHVCVHVCVVCLHVPFLLESNHDKALMP